MSQTSPLSMRNRTATPASAARRTRVLQALGASLQHSAAANPTALKRALRQTVASLREGAEGVHVVVTVQVLAEVLGGIAAEHPVAPSKEHAALADSDARIRRHRRALIARAKLVTGSVLAQRLGVTRQALNKAVKAHRLFNVEMGGEYFYPAFFAETDLDRRDLEAVSRALGELTGWEKWHFFTEPNAALGRRTPVAAMRKGDRALVLRAATGAARP